jgi:hypothetical protein
MQPAIRCVVTPLLPALSFLLLHPLCAPALLRMQKERPTTVDMNEPVVLNFAMRYLVNFSKVRTCTPCTRLGG